MEFGNFPLKDKVVVMTAGSTAPLYLAFAKRAYDRGAKGIVIGSLFSWPDLEEFMNSADGRVVFQKTDVTDWKQLLRLVNNTTKKFDTPDVFVTGYFKEPVTGLSSFWRDDDKERYDFLDINVSHVIKFTHLAMRNLVVTDKNGVVLIMSSSPVSLGDYVYPLNVVAGHAIAGFVKSMALAEYWEGVKIMMIALNLDVTTHIVEARADQSESSQRRKINVDDVADVMVEAVEGGKVGGGSIVQVASSDKPDLKYRCHLLNTPQRPPKLEGDGSVSVARANAFQAVKEIWNQLREVALPGSSQGET